MARPRKKEDVGAGQAPPAEEVTEAPEATAEEPAAEEKPKKRAPRKKAEEPKAEEKPKRPPRKKKAEEPVAEEPVAEEPIAEEPVPEPVAEEAPAEEPVAEEPVAEEAPAEEPEPVGAELAPPAEEAEPAAEEAPAAEAPAEEPAAEEAPAEEPVAEAPAEVAPGKPKKKRLPRAQRRRRSKPVRGRTGARKPITRLPKPEHVRSNRKERRGIVVSVAMDKTIVVRVDTLKAHPVYKKVVRRSKRLHAHDELNVAKAGDVVRIVETRPLSKTKTWRLAEVVEEAK
jgi:small subunit ribosomal protein S17